MQESHFLDRYEYIWEAGDKSLASVYPFLVAVNMTRYSHWILSIHIPSNDEVFYNKLWK